MTWFNAPWLFVECYLYRRIVGAIAKSRHFSDFDPFAIQKETAFVASIPFILVVADYLHEAVNSSATLSDPEKTVLTLLQVRRWNYLASTLLSDLIMGQQSGFIVDGRRSTCA